MNIVYAGNKNVQDGLFLSVMSIIKHTNRKINIYVLTMDLSDIDKTYLPIPDHVLNKLEQLLKEKNKDSKVIKLDLTTIFKKSMNENKNLDNRYTPFALLRLYLDQVDEIPDKVLYLDVDTMAHNDISTLYDINIDKYELAGARDRYGKFFLMFKYGFNYMNSGVLLLNMKKIKETGMFEKVRKLLDTKKVFLSDQSGINKMVKHKKIINYRFNSQKVVKNNTVIRHFSMQFRIFPKWNFVNIKPWHTEQLHKVYKCHDFDETINAYAKIKQSIGD